MKYLFLCLLFSFCVLSCNLESSQSSNSIDSFAVYDPPASDKQSYAHTIDSLIINSPTPKPTFLQFMLGSSKEEAERHIRSLIKAGKIEGLHYVKYDLINAKIEGYPYNLYTSETEPIETLLIPNYYGGKLYMVSLFPTGGREARDKIKEFLISQYGEPIYKEQAKSGYASDYTFYWLKNGYEISFSDATFGAVEFADPSIKKEMRDFKNKVDSIEKSLSKEAAKETKKDFQ